MSEDEAAELLLSQRAHFYYGLGWKIAMNVSPFGDNYRTATEEEALILDKVKDIIAGKGSESEYNYSVPPEIRDSE